ncbi:hypothetical protein ACFTZF_46915, partial [Streptomyces mirabilis]|uniref:hypothetical protein n=1 Tax=Streptomyces mirabilis TaxID=68239 RepID=UPI003639EEAC
MGHGETRKTQQHENHDAVDALRRWRQQGEGKRSRRSGIKRFTWADELSAPAEFGRAACLPDVARGPVIAREKTPEAPIPSPSPGRPAPPTNLDLSADNQQRHSIVFWY